MFLDGVKHETARLCGCPPGTAPPRPLKPTLENDRPLSTKAVGKWSGIGVRTLKTAMIASARTLGFKSMKTAYATIKGFEVMRMFKKGKFTPWIDAICGGTEARFIHRLFGIYA